MTPESYSRVYDSAEATSRKVKPQMKFVALALALSLARPEFFEYFRNREEP